MRPIADDIVVRSSSVTEGGVREGVTAGGLRRGMRVGVVSGEAVPIDDLSGEPVPIDDLSGEPVPIDDSLEDASSVWVYASQDTALLRGGAPQISSGEDGEGGSSVIGSESTAAMAATRRSV